MTKQENAKTLSARKQIEQIVLTAESKAVIDASMDSISTRLPKNAHVTRHALLRIVTSVVKCRRRFVSNAPLTFGLIAHRISALMPHAKLTNVMTVQFWDLKNATSASQATLSLMIQLARTVIQIQTRSSVKSPSSY